MPELPDIVVYVEALRERIEGRTLLALRLGSPFLLRTADPPISRASGKRVCGVRRQGKRLVLELEEELFLVLHLMIAGRLHWKPVGAKIGSKNALAAFDFENGTLTLTEGGTKRRAALFFLRGEERLRALDRGGIEPLEATEEQFTQALRCENHTLKRSFTDPRLFSGIGNAYSDEILHRARLSPVRLTGKLTDAEIEVLYRATREVLLEWVDRLRAEAKEGFPEGVTAFRPEMAVHGMHGKPCPVCGTSVQRIVYADNETNYCPECQTEGRLLADRALSRLLKGDWPRSLTELEERVTNAGGNTGRE